MTREEIVRTLREDLKVKKDGVALKAETQPPSHIPPYEGQALPGMCTVVGEILKKGFVCYVTKENLGCFEALVSTGTCENLQREEYLNVIIEQNALYPMHKDAATVVSYYDQVDNFFKHPLVAGSGLIVGPLAKLDEPDLILLFLTPHQADILTRCFAFLGDFTCGFGGLGGCIFNLRYAFVTGAPCFSTSDTAWRVFAGLDENELTYTLPFIKLQQIAAHIKPTAEYVHSFKDIITF